MSDPRPGAGWHSYLPEFVDTDASAIESSLANFVRDVSREQQVSWHNSIKWLKREYGQLIGTHEEAESYTTLLEYELPRDFRRPDIIVLEGAVIVVLEVKGRGGNTQSARDQVTGYMRDLSAYHGACAGRKIVSVVVPSDWSAGPKEKDAVWVMGTEDVHPFLLKMAHENKGEPVTAEAFLDDDAYAPLPTIVSAARSLYEGRPLPFIKRARANTDPALQAISEITHNAARSGTRNLVLLSGVPGSGKTLVGLQLVHAGWLDDLTVERKGKKMSPAVYLSGNGPLVAVLQDALKGGPVPGSVFVQDIKRYVAYYSNSRGHTPPEHLIVFDEAQRAHDAERVATVHKRPIGPSEPEHLLEFCARIPDWCVLVALIGDGQAIHAGEEIGVRLWADAIAERHPDENWSVHGATQLQGYFAESASNCHWIAALNLDAEIRFHLTPKVHAFVESLLEEAPVDNRRAIGDELFDGGHRFLITRSLDDAKRYLHERYEGAPLSRYGILASSKDKILPQFDVDNTFQKTKRLKVGAWYNRPADDALSCCQLETVATEFSSQGLELDAALVAWGSDLIRENGEWSMRMSRGTRGNLHDPLQLRKNVYRVLLTRGRDGTVVYVPESEALEETWKFLLESGFRELAV
ncbi:DNA/RNA helicase domain-containing protein [Woeseia oceani]|uniref:Schlafen group 3-like DNA/RNA helicase domain-containing protein n=1 Tax=Woeseia oceani TaxID=1548547 RepID=A0A193LHE1_9GAMM|nr:DNA/RNA helicase domain-containing protein [Woeseia oceani]ANO51878.1 hypothetical protein BA177_12305 [Woeseia oceani]